VVPDKVEICYVERDPRWTSLQD